MSPGTTREVAGFQVTFDGVDRVEGPNYAAEEGRFTLVRGGATRSTIAERRVYSASGMPTTEAAIETYAFSQLYLQLGDAVTDGYVVRVWYKPWITLIWLGAVVMALAGFLSLTDRRLRVGVPRRAVPQPAAAE
jgi:cytochrome c-type biogenesis protein CcmF